MIEAKPIFVYKIPRADLEVLSDKVLKKWKSSIKKSLDYKYLVMIVAIEDYCEMEIIK